MLKNVLNFCLDLIYPTCCCECKAIGPYLCKRCYEELNFYTLPPSLELEPCFLDSVTVALYYQKPITSVIHAMKYQSVKGIGQYLGNLLYDTTNFPEAECVVPIPLHPRRQSDRGFNQAEEIARSFSFSSKIPYRPLLKRTKHAVNQASISDREKRKINASEIFAYSAPPGFPIPNSALLIDDVMTTGATLNEAAKVLKDQGVKQVFGLVVAHGA